MATDPDPVLNPKVCNNRAKEQRHQRLVLTKVLVKGLSKGNEEKKTLLFFNMLFFFLRMLHNCLMMPFSLLLDGRFSLVGICQATLILVVCSTT